MEQDRDFTEKEWSEEVRLDEEYEDWVAEVGEEEAAAYAQFIAEGGNPEDWAPPDEEEEEPSAAGVLQRGRDQVNGSWTPTESESYEAQLAMYQAMAMAQAQARQAQTGSGAVLYGQAAGGAAPMGRWLAVLTAAWLAKDVAAKLFRARL